MDTLVLLDIHIIGAAAIFGIGLAIAFVMLVAYMMRDSVFLGRSALVILIADIAFAITAGLIQPISGYLLMRETGFGMSDGWLALSLGLYVIAGLLALFLALMQWRMRRLALEASGSASPLPTAYDRLVKRSFILAFLSFLILLAVLALMIARPTFS